MVLKLVDSGDGINVNDNRYHFNVKNGIILSCIDA